MSKEPLKSFINKVGTFRGKKSSSQRPSTTDLKYPNENDENFFRSAIDESHFNNDSCSQLDTTAKSISTTSHLFRSSVQTLTEKNLPTLSIYDTMSDEQINEEFEKSLLTVLNLKSDKDMEKMRELPIEHKKLLLKNNKKNDNEMDDKATELASSLIKAVKESRNLKENLKHLLRILKKISLCMGKKTVSWLQEFHQANGINALQDIIIDYKTKYSILYNNNTG